MKDPLLEIKEYLSAKSKIPVEELSDTTRIIESGIVRSLVVLEMIAHLEKKYGIEFDAKDLNEENFKDIRTLGSLVNQAVAKAQSDISL